MSDSVTPLTAARQAPLALGFSRQEYWSGFPFLSPGDLPDPDIKPRSPTLAGRYFIPSHQKSQPSLLTFPQNQKPTFLFSLISVHCQQNKNNFLRLPWHSSGEDFALQCRACRFDPWLPLGQKKKKRNRSSILINSIKTLKKWSPSKKKIFEKSFLNLQWAKWN